MKKLLDIYINLSEKNKIVISNMMGTFVIKGCALFISLFTMPAYISFFNNEVSLGLWFTLLSVLTWILNFDLGIGNGLRNKLVKSLSEGRIEDSKLYISSAYMAIGGLSTITLGIFLLVFNQVNWNMVFNIDCSIVTDMALSISIAIVFFGIVCQLFLKLICSILYAMQKSSVNNLLTLCTSILTLLLIKIVPSQSNDINMILMSIIHAIAVIVPLLVATIIVFNKKDMMALKPSIQYFSLKHARDVLSLGGTFFIIQIAYMFIMNTNEYLITLFIGNESVVEYQIYNKMFLLVSTIFSLALTPIWSAVTKAIAEKDFKWIKKLYKRLILLAIFGSICEFAMIPILQLLVNIWLGDEAITVNVFYSIAFAVMASLMIFNSVLSSIANGSGQLKTQFFAFCLGAGAKIPLAWLLVTMMGDWCGVLLANIVPIFIYCILEQFSLKQYIKANE